MDTQQRIPTDTYITARLKAVFMAGIYKIANYISFAVFPLDSFQAIRIDITLPKSESGFVGGCEYGKFASGSFGCLYPLISIEFGWIKNVIIFNGGDAVIALSVADTIEYMLVVMKDCSHFGFMPFQLMRLGDRNTLLLRKTTN